jgi:hypothetical protein
MERLGEDLDRELRRFGVHGVMPAIVAAWPAAVGPEIARNAWPARVGKDRVLHVNAASSAWSFELTQLADAVLERLALAVGDDAPRGIRFAPGPIPDPPAEAPAEAPRERISPSEDAVVRAHSIAADIDDEELREQVAAAIALSLERARSDRRF